MLSFNKRSYQKEWLDRDDIPFVDIQTNMRELDFINRTLGGHAITLNGLNKILPKQVPVGKKFQVVEIGCGGGDNLRAIQKWAAARNLPVQLTGIDINAECIAFAQSQQGNTGITFIHSNYREVDFSKQPDVIFSSLFCHHFTDEELVGQLQWMFANSETGFFINDLHRHPLSFYAIQLLTRFFSRSYLVRNDAPLSVRRGFRRKEWHSLLTEAGIKNSNCQWRWAFRWLVTCQKNGTIPNI